MSNNPEYKEIIFDKNYIYKSSGGDNNNIKLKNNDEEYNDENEDEELSVENNIELENDNEESTVENNIELENDNEESTVELENVQQTLDNNIISDEEIKKTSNNESDIKTINFTNNQIDNIFFNNVEENNINKFLENNKNIIIEEEVALKNSEIIYKDDNIYLKQLINQLLSEYKVTSQESKYIQKIVEKKALDIIEIKNIGIIDNDMFEKGIEYKLIYDIFYDNFKSNIIIPIVSDKHKIYVNLKENRDQFDNEKNNTIQNVYFS